MIIGKGKYDDEGEALLREQNAAGVIVAVLGGNKGSGFSVVFRNGAQTIATMEAMPNILRMIADMMDADMKEFKAAPHKGN